MFAAPGFVGPPLARPAAAVDNAGRLLKAGALPEMSSQDSFDALMARLQAGDGAAAARVFLRFTDRLIELAGRQLTTSVRRKEDPEDVVQSVFRSFFTRQRAGLITLVNWDSLWGLLTVMTLRKCGHRIAYYRAARRDVGREATDDGWGALEQLVAREPTPPEAAALAELVERLLRDLEPHERQIVGLHLQGYTQQEISAGVGRAERTVRRTVERARKRLLRLHEKDGTRT
jgi:RNA polymerase sigma-70 factor (ECF subfamily)